MPGLTAKQMLMFSSRLKNSDRNTDHERNAMKWLDELDLLDTKDTLVEKCSGGERKRLAVALELTSIEMGPNLICIDEPTSGLDSNSARIVSIMASFSLKYNLTHFLADRLYRHCINWPSLTL